MLSPRTGADVRGEVETSALAPRSQSSHHEALDQGVSGCLGTCRRFAHRKNRRDGSIVRRFDLRDEIWSVCIRLLKLKQRLLADSNEQSQ
jgi:hypothetical protein